MGESCSVCMAEAVLESSFGARTEAWKEGFLSSVWLLGGAIVTSVQELLASMLLLDGEVVTSVQELLASMLLLDGEVVTSVQELLASVLLLDGEVVTSVQELFASVLLLDGEVVTSVQELLASVLLLDGVSSLLSVKQLLSALRSCVNSVLARGPLLLLSGPPSVLGLASVLGGAEEVAG